MKSEGHGFESRASRRVLSRRLRQIPQLFLHIFTFPAKQFSAVLQCSELMLLATYEAQGKTLYRPSPDNISTSYDAAACHLVEAKICEAGRVQQQTDGWVKNLSCYFSYFLLLAPVPRHTAPRSSKMLSYKFNLFSPFKKIRGKLTRNVFQKLAILSLCFCLFLVYSINNIISQQLNVKTSYIQTHKVSIQGILPLQLDLGATF